MDLSIFIPDRNNKKLIVPAQELIQGQVQSSDFQV